MADIKTNLRETSVLVGLSCIKYNCVEKQTDVDHFKKTLTALLCEDIKHCENIFELQSFSLEQLDIIKNGFALAKKISEILDISSNLVVKWSGYNTQKDTPVDIEVNGRGFSLKENSFILENMGLYKLIGNLTGEKCKRGKNIFKEYAAEEYNSWFNYVWTKLVNSISWDHSKNNEKQSFIVLNNDVELTYQKGNDIFKKIVPKNISSIDQYEDHTDAKIREHVVSKWINSHLSSETQYVCKKKECAEKAGKNLTNYINANLNYNSLARLLQIYEQKYFYAKTTSSGVVVFEVPCLSEYTDVISVKSITSSVAKSQLNIITTIENTRTKKQFILRNECRFSHGQFNGTPEAKMYYDSASDLSVLYTKI